MKANVVDILAVAARTPSLVARAGDILRRDRERAERRAAIFFRATR